MVRVVAVVMLEVVIMPAVWPWRSTRPHADLLDFSTELLSVSLSGIGTCQGAKGQGCARLPCLQILLIIWTVGLTSSEGYNKHGTMYVFQCWARIPGTPNSLWGSM